jgi:hypothetical protein
VIGLYCSSRDCFGVPQTALSISHPQAMAVSSAHCQLMADVGRFADEEWLLHGDFIAGKLAFEAVYLKSVVNSHPALPVFMYNLGLIPMASNGASIELWSSPDPLCLCILNVNHSQTRKSRLTGEAETLSGLIDQACDGSFAAIWDAKVKLAATFATAKRRRLQDEDGDEEQEPHPAAHDNHKVGVFPGSVSVAFLGGTIERVRERCAGDCNMVRQTKVVQKLPALNPATIQNELMHLNEVERVMAAKPGMQGRIWYGSGLVYDEVYQFLQDVSILDKPSEKKLSDAAGAGQTPLAGWFNRLVQSGKSDHETKSNGSHGGLDCLPVSLSLLGNFHPTPAIEMIRGERGDHGCQAKARVIVTTGLPVQPHEAFQAAGSVTCNMKWVPVPPEVQSAVGLGQCSSVHAFVHFFNPTAAASPRDGEDDSALPASVPDLNGFQHTLPDKVVTRVRMMYFQGRYRLEWQLPDRRLKIPDTMDISSRMQKFIKHGMQTPHRKITLSDEARDEFISFQTMYNIKVKQARDANDADSGAEHGIAPWKLGQLSAALLLWDIMWDVKVVMYKEVEWVVELNHVRRAYKLMSILEGMREGFRTNKIALAAMAEGASEAAGAGVGEDRDLPGRPSVNGTKGTAFARRMLFKSSATDIEGEYACSATKTFTLYTHSEKASMGKVSVFLFRDIAKACPSQIGQFDAQKDALIWSLPSEPSEEWKLALLQYANTTVASLRDGLVRLRAINRKSSPSAQQTA